MKLVAASFIVALAVGYAAGGRLSRMGGLKVRWPIVAMVGLALQVAPVPGTTLPLMLLWVSFGLLFAFAVSNIRVAGFVFIFIGMNSRLHRDRCEPWDAGLASALVASGARTAEALVEDGGAKHHLATSSDQLLFLGDVTPIAPIHQAVSLGDFFTYSGSMWAIESPRCGAEYPVSRNLRRWNMSLRNRKTDRRAPRRPSTRLYELAVAVPLVAWLISELLRGPDRFEDPLLLLWVAAIGIVDLLPVPIGQPRIQPQLPLQLAVALIYPPPVAAAVALLGTSDMPGDPARASVARRCSIPGGIGHLGDDKAPVPLVQTLDLPVTGSAAPSCHVDRSEFYDKPAPHQLLPP